MLALAQAGCRMVGHQPICLTAPYRPTNVYSGQDTLPVNLVRVAVLPLTCNGPQTSMVAGRQELDPLLIAQLIATKKFEVIPVSAAELQRQTGRAYWTGAETLPSDFFATLRKTYGCDAVLFCELTEFRPYQPLAVGWRLRLVNARDRRILWACDEQFDAGEPAVIAGALRYQRQNQDQPDDDSAGWLALNSPRWFGQYTLAEVLSTLPRRR